MPNNTIAPDTEPAEEEADDALPALPEDLAADLDAVPDAGIGAGRKVVARFAAHAPSAPGVYRMIGADGDVLYVGKAKNIKKRVLSYARPTGQVTRIARMVAITASIECVTTATETEALLLEANLIKRLRPRFNVLLRDDKSFPYILISQGERPAQILKHRGARNREGAFFGPFAAVNAVEPHHHGAGARFFAALLCGCGVRQPHPAVPAPPDQALRGAVHRRNIPRRL